MKRRQAAPPRTSWAERPVLLSQTSRPGAVRARLTRDALRDAWIILAVNMNAAIFFGMAPLTAGYGAAESLIFLGVQFAATTAGVGILLAATLWTRGPVSLRRARRTMLAKDLALAAGWGGSSILFLSPSAFETNILVLLLLTSVATISAAFSAWSPVALALARAALFTPAVVWLAIVAPPYWGLMVGLAGFAAAITQVVGQAIYSGHLLRADQAVALARARDALADRSASLEAALTEARESRADAMREAALREQFMRAVTHDLRQPVGALGLYLSEAARRAPELADALDPARSCVVSANTIIDSVAQVALIADGLPEPRLAPVALNPLFEKLEEETRALARHYRLGVRRAPTGLSVMADPDLLERALRNLLHNALQYAGTGDVLIGARRRGARVSVEVWDCGPGVPAAERAAIFDAFHQLPRDGRRGLGNVGLGLSIVRDFSAAMGGAASLCSREGKGSRFSILLPATAPSPVHEPADLRGFDILIVDDDLLAAQDLAAAVKALGAGARAVVDGRAIRALGSEGVAGSDALVLDCRLAPGFSGFDLLARLGAAAPPVVLVTSAADGALRAQAQAAGLTILEKPVSAPVLGAALREGLSQSGEAARPGRGDRLHPVADVETPENL